MLKFVYTFYVRVRCSEGFSRRTMLDNLCSWDKMFIMLTAYLFRHLGRHKYRHLGRNFEISAEMPASVHLLVHARHLFLSEEYTVSRGQWPCKNAKRENCHASMTTDKYIMTQSTYFSSPGTTFSRQTDVQNFFYLSVLFSFPQKNAQVHVETGKRMLFYVIMCNGLGLRSCET